METSVVRQRVLGTLDRVKRDAKERRSRVDEAARDFEAFLEKIAIPLCRQLAQILKAEHVAFIVNTPSGAVRFASERSGDDYIELSLDTSGETPYVVGHTRHMRGSRVVDAIRPVRECPVRELTEDHLLDFLLREIEALLRPS